jgi:hypothetical protein
MRGGLATVLLTLALGACAEQSRYVTHETDSSGDTQIRPVGDG